MVKARLQYFEGSKPTSKTSAGKESTRKSISFVTPFVVVVYVIYAQKYFDSFFRKRFSGQDFAPSSEINNHPSLIIWYIT